MQSHNTLPTITSQRHARNCGTGAATAAAKVLASGMLAKKIDMELDATEHMGQPVFGIHSLQVAHKKGFLFMNLTFK